MSWTQANASISIELIKLAGVDLDLNIIDVGSGETVLIGQLAKLGFKHLTVLDISEAAVQRAKMKLGSSAESIKWIISDVTEANLTAGHFDLWHDRAVFHFLTEPEQRKKYVVKLTDSVKPGGFAIIATFSLSGPDRCSGLPVMKYSCDSLESEIGNGFQPIKCLDETHATPWGKPQDFVYHLFKRLP